MTTLTDKETCTFLKLADNPGSVLGCKGAELATVRRLEKKGVIAWAIGQGETGTDEKGEFAWTISGDWQLTPAGANLLAEIHAEEKAAETEESACAPQTDVVQEVTKTANQGLENKMETKNAEAIAAAETTVAAAQDAFNAAELAVANAVTARDEAAKYAKDITKYVKDQTAYVKSLADDAADKEEAEAALAEGEANKVTGVTNKESTAKAVKEARTALTEKRRELKAAEKALKVAKGETGGGRKTSKVADDTVYHANPKHRGGIAGKVVAEFDGVRTVAQAVEAIKESLGAEGSQAKGFTENPESFIKGYIAGALRRGELGLKAFPAPAPAEEPAAE